MKGRCVTKWFMTMALLTLTVAACGDSAEPGNETLQCGQGTIAIDGTCFPLDGLRCGSGTREEAGECVPSEGLSCGEGTREVNGRCVGDGIVCGSGTTEVEGACVPTSGLTCGAGTSEVDGACVPDAPPQLTPPTVTLVSTPETFLIGDTRPVTFTVDAVHDWRLELGGQYEGDGEFLSEGSGNANSLVSTTVDADDLGIGHHALRLYVSVEEQNVRATSVVEIRVFVRGDLSVLVWGRGGNTLHMFRDLLLLDEHIATAEVRSDTVTNPSPPSVEYLLGFDVVVLAWSSNIMQPLTGNVLAQYVDGGGAVVIWPGTWTGTWFEGDGHPSWLQGNWMTGQYGALGRPSAEPYFTTATANIGTVVAGHPILDGVTSLTVTTRPVQPLTEGATLVASWSDNVPLVATKGPVVSLGWQPTSADANLGGNWQRLVTNAVTYAASQVSPD